MSRSFRKRVSSALRALGTRSDRAKVSRGDHSRDRRHGFEYLMFEQLEPRMVLSTGPLVISEFMAANAKRLAGRRRRVFGLDRDPQSDRDRASTGRLVSDRRRPRLDQVAISRRFRSTRAAYLVVFASGKDRTNPAAELHTNFKLSADGEYLALVMPDGETIAHEYAPQYPQQLTSDKSYGIEQSVTTLVAEGAELQLSGADRGRRGRRTGPRRPSTTRLGTTRRRRRRRC